MTPLHIAAWKGNLELIQCLIKYGADVMARGKFNQTNEMQVITET